MTTLQERLAAANTEQATLTDKENTQRITEELETNSLRIRQDLADILGCGANNVPEWYIAQNPHLLMGLDNLQRSAGAELAKADLRENFRQAVEYRHAVEAEAMAQRYRGAILVDHDGNRSTLAVEHQQATGSGSAPYPRAANYKSALPSVFQLRLVDFSGVRQSDWIDNIGSPENCTLNETSASVLFDDVGGLSFCHDSSVEALCDSLKIDYWHRPSGYVICGLFNGSNLKQAIPVQFDSFATDRTSRFSCIAEAGDHLQFMSVPLRDETDAMKAINAISNNTAPSYFKWVNKLQGVFL